jgi:hypothetical protein
MRLPFRFCHRALPIDLIRADRRSRLPHRKGENQDTWETMSQKGAETDRKFNGIAFGMLKKLPSKERSSKAVSGDASGGKWERIVVRSWMRTDGLALVLPILTASGGMRSTWPEREFVRLGVDQRHGAPLAGDGPGDLFPSAVAGIGVVRSQSQLRHNGRGNWGSTGLISSSGAPS